MENMVLGLEVTIVSLIAVFFTLYLLSLLINLFKNILGSKKKASPAKTHETLTIPQTKTDDSEELVAVITAAIQAYEETK